MRTRAPYEHPGTLIPRLAREFGPFDTLLDVGGGGGTVGRDVWLVRAIHVMDIFPPATTPPDFRLGDVRELVLMYGPKSYDVVQCTEVIEHLERSEGRHVLEQLEAVARCLVVVTTPNGFVPQDPEHEPGEPWAHNPYQKHLSGFEPEFFEQRGYVVHMNAGDVTEMGAQICAFKDMRGTR